MSVTVELLAHDPKWADRYREEEAKIRLALGEEVRAIDHVGSTSVPGLAAKPVIDIVLSVGDSADETSYARDLEDLGYVLRLREPDWYEHRLFRGTGDDVNLHVFSDGAEEIARMIRFRDRLRSDEADRTLYEAVKLALADKSWGSEQDYADAKSEVVEEILARS